MKRMPGIVLVILMALTMFSTANAATRQLRFWHAGFTDPIASYVQKELLPEFEKAYDVKVDFQMVGWGAARTNKLITAVIGGVGPDVVILGSNYHVMEQAVLQPLDSFIATWKDKGTIAQPLWETKRSNGKIWCIPHSGEIRGMAYHARMFEGIGLPDRPPASWEEWLQAVKKLTRADGDKLITAGFEWGWSESDYRWLALMAGSDLADWNTGKSYLNNGHAAEALEFMSELRQASMPPGFKRLSWVDFSTQKVAMTWGIPMALRYAYDQGGEDIGNQVRIYAPRRSPSIRPATLALVNGFGITKQASDPELAWKLIEFLMSRESMVGLMNAGYEYMLLRSDVLATQSQNPKLKLFLPFYSLMPDAIEGLPGPWTTPFRTGLNTIVAKVLNKQIAPTQAVSDMETVINNLFKATK